ncbi:MAG: hypothetical protein P8Y48_10010 [Novosphingobium sp.]
MKRPLVLTCLAASVLSLSACYDGYDNHVAAGWSSYPYYGWYDGYYGPIHDGYWADNTFYYRLSPRDRTFRRGDPLHFRRGDARSTGPHFRHFQGTLRPPPRGTRMPRFQPPRNRPSPAQPRRDRRDPR